MQSNENIFKAAFKDYWSNYFTIKGKVQPKCYWAEVLLFVIMLYGSAFLLGLVSPSLVLVEDGITLILFVPIITASIRRIQDAGFSVYMGITLSLIFVGGSILEMITKIVLISVILDCFLLYFLLNPSKSKKNNSKRKQQ